MVRVKECEKKDLDWSELVMAERSRDPGPGAAGTWRDSRRVSLGMGKWYQKLNCQLSIGTFTKYVLHFIKCYCHLLILPQMERNRIGLTFSRVGSDSSRGGPHQNRGLSPPISL